MTIPAFTQPNTQSGGRQYKKFFVLIGIVLVVLAGVDNLVAFAVVRFAFPASENIVPIETPINPTPVTSCAVVTLQPLQACAPWPNARVFKIINGIKLEDSSDPTQAILVTTDSRLSEKWDAVPNRSQYSRAFGQDNFSNDYRIFSFALSVTPSWILRTRNPVQILRIIAMLQLKKQLNFLKDSSPVYALSSGSIRGFQFGNAGTADSLPIEIFDSAGNSYFVLGSRQVSQSMINYFIGSFKEQ